MTKQAFHCNFWHNNSTTSYCSRRGVRVCFYDYLLASGPKCLCSTHQNKEMEFSPHEALHVIEEYPKWFYRLKCLHLVFPERNYSSQIRWTIWNLTLKQANPMAAIVASAIVAKSIEWRRQCHLLHRPINSPKIRRTKKVVLANDPRLDKRVPGTLPTCDSDSLCRQLKVIV